MASVSIGDAPRNELVCLEGRVRSTGDTHLLSPVTRRACLAFETHGGLFKGEAETEEAQDFLLEDASGVVLVRMVDYELELGELKGQAGQAILETDLDAVSTRIHDLKAQLVAEPQKRDAVQGELRDWKAVATLLCAVRAHKNGKVHTGHTLEGQAQFIQENKAALSKAEALRHTSWRYLERFDTILQDGDMAQCVGVLVEERDPDAEVQNYRGFAKRLVLKAPDGGALQVRAEGARATQAAFQDLEKKKTEAVNPKAESNVGCVVFYVILFSMAALLVKWIWF